LINRPPVLTNRCCKLVNDHFSILFGSSSRRTLTRISDAGGLVPVLKRSEIIKLAIETNKKLFLTPYHKCWRYWRADILCGGCLLISA